MKCIKVSTNGLFTTNEGFITKNAPSTSTQSVHPPNQLKKLTHEFYIANSLLAHDLIIRVKVIYSAIVIILYR